MKSVDIAGGLLTLAIGTLAYLLAAAVLDHWLIPGGMGFWGRLGMLLVLLATGGVYFALAVLPPLLHRINPIFAAQTIEQSRPTLKNSLINFLLLRNHRREVRRWCIWPWSAGRQPTSRKSASTRPSIAAASCGWDACWPACWPSARLCVLLAEEPLRFNARGYSGPGPTWRHRRG